MTRRGTFSGREVIKALTRFDFVPVDRTGSHVKLRLIDDAGEVRNVTVPLHDELGEDTLRSIAEQAGAKDFGRFCEWIDEHG